MMKLLLLIGVFLVAAELSRAQNSTRQAGKQYYINAGNWHWFSALEQCHAKGYELVSTTIREEYVELVNYLLSNGLEKETYWTSGQNLNKNIDYTWVSTGATFNESNWALGEPQDGNSGYNSCVFIYNLAYYSDDCLGQRPYICEY